MCLENSSFIKTCQE